MRAISGGTLADVLSTCSGWGKNGPLGGYLASFSATEAFPNLARRVGISTTKLSESSSAANCAGAAIAIALDDTQDKVGKDDARGLISGIVASVLVRL